LALANAPPSDGEDASSLGDFADPFVLREGSSYYAFATGVGARNIQAARSLDLKHWRSLPDPLPELPQWAEGRKGLTWAPSVFRRKDRFVLYYTARDRASGFQCISRAVSQKPDGPYQDESAEPFVCQVTGTSAFCGSIDPSPFVAYDGTPYLLWKSDENSAFCRKPPRIWVQRMSDDGIGLREGPASLLSMDRSWESPIIEGPSMMMRDGSYFLFYSANWYESAAYAIGYAICAGPTGPCRKATGDTPFFHSAGPVIGPGGQQFFDDQEGRPWMAYHAWSPPSASYRDGGMRSLRLAPMAVVNGVPVLVDPR
jgi:beta-xylosidase